MQQDILPWIPDLVLIRHLRRSGTTYASRRIRLLPVHFREKTLQLCLERLVLGSLVELAQVVATGAKRIKCKAETSHAEILSRLLACGYVECFCMAYHAAGMVLERDARSIHQPEIWVTQALFVESRCLVPGF